MTDDRGEGTNGAAPPAPAAGSITPMRILYLHQFYAGANAPGPEQPRELVRTLASRGHRVEVVACDFNAYNEQTEAPEEWTDPSGGSVRVHRLPAPRGLRANLRRRFSTYTGFAWSAYRFARTMPPPQVVMATIQPLFTGYAALRLARRWRVPFLLELRDLWPDALLAKGAIARWQAALLEVMARKIYRGADRLVSLTPGIRRELLNKGLPRSRIDIFPNGHRARAFAGAAASREAVRREFGWGDSFVAVYAGTHTEVTAVDVMVLAAARLLDRPKIRIDLFGTGQSKQAAIDLAQRFGLRNIHFHDPVPKSRIPQILAGADVALMTLFQSPLIHIYFENKLIDYMGAGKPILAAMGGLQSRLIEREHAGRVVPSLDHEGLARLIREAAADPKSLVPLGAAGHAYIRTHLAQEVILDRYASVLEALARGEAAALPVWDPIGID